MDKKIAMLGIVNNSDFFKLLKQHAHTKLNERFKWVNIPFVERHLVQYEYNLYFVDYSTALKERTYFQSMREKYRSCYSVVYGAPAEIDTSSLMALGRLKGYFLSDISNQEFAEGINQVASGGTYIPQAITHQLLEYLQALVVRYSEPCNIHLTQRELHVLQHLRNGASNSKLADELFISEHTIKSHLYKIFKKLNISSRADAILWAHKYLP